MRTILLPIILFLSGIAAIPCIAQEAMVTVAFIDKNSPLDFIIGEPITIYAEPAAIGFLPSMHLVSLSNSIATTYHSQIEVKFDIQQQSILIKIPQEIISTHSSYYIYDTKGILHLHDFISQPIHTIHYAQIPNGIYILRIVGLMGQQSHLTRWIKK